MSGYCSCDDIGDSRCAVHGAAMAAQDRRIAARNAGIAPCPTCGGEGGWQDDYEEDGVERDGMLHPRECPDCFGYGTLDAKALLTMVLELRSEIGTLHDGLTAQQAGHEADRLDASRPALVILCRELGLPIHEDPRDGIRDFVREARRRSDILG
jgi:hypothetical protein